MMKKILLITSLSLCSPLAFAAAPAAPLSDSSSSTATVQLPTPAIAQASTNTAKQSNNPSTTDTNLPTQPVNRIVAIVNSQIITQDELDLQLNIIKAQLSQQNTPLPSENELIQQVLNQLINRDIQLQLAKQNNIRVSSQQIDAAIQRIAQEHQASVAEVYQQAQQTGLSRKQLRQQIQDDITIQKLQEDAMASHITVTPQEVSNYLQEMASNPKAQGEFDVKDILVALPATPSPEQVTTAKAKADKIVAELKQGANFKQLAVAQSGGQNALQGGDLGWRKLAELPESFAKAVEYLQAGQIAGPIRTANGFHIIKLAGTRGITAQSNVNQVQLQEIEINANQKQTAAQTTAQLKKLETELSNGADFSTLAKKYSEAPSADKGGYMDWAIPSSYPEAIQTAIKNLKPGDISPVIDAGNQHYYIIKFLGQRQTTLSTEEERQQAQQAIFQRKLLEALQTWVSQLRAQAYVKILPPQSE